MSTKRYGLFSSWGGGDNYVLELRVVMVIQLCDYIKANQGAS